MAKRSAAKPHLRRHHADQRRALLQRQNITHRDSRCLVGEMRQLCGNILLLDANLF